MHGRRVQAPCTGVAERLAGRLDVPAAQQLADQLHRLPVTGRGSAVDDGGTHRGQCRPNDVERASRSARHDQQVAGAGAGDPATDRGVHELNPASVQTLGQSTHGVGTHRAHDHDHRVLRQRSTAPSLPNNASSHWASFTTMTNSVGFPGGLERRLCADRSLVGQGLLSLGDGVEDGQRVGDVDETRRHRRPHRSEADESDSFQCHAFGLSRRMLTTRASVSVLPTLPGKITGQVLRQGALGDTGTDPRADPLQDIGVLVDRSADHWPDPYTELAGQHL